MVSSSAPGGFPVHREPTTAEAEAKASRAVKPQGIALGVFGGIAGLVALIVASQVIGRQLRLDADDRRTMRALGAPRSRRWSTAFWVSCCPS